MPLRPDYTFERFIATAGNHRAVRACNALVRAPSSHALLLVGPPGTGKTHLLQAVGHKVAAARASTTLAYTPARLLCEELVEAIRRGDALAALSDRYARHAFVLIDDVQELTGKPATQHEVARLIAACLRSGARVLCGTTRWPFDREFTGSAWANARVVHLTPPSAEEITRIVRRASATEAVPLSRRTIHSFAQHARGDVRRALGALALWRLRLQLSAR